MVRLNGNAVAKHATDAHTPMSEFCQEARSHWPLQNHSWRLVGQK